MYHFIKVSNLYSLNLENPILSPASVDDEERIILRCQTDPASFEVLYEKYFKKIFLFVLHRVGDKALTSDITQQVFVKALTNIRKFQFRGLPFSSWLFRVAINECNEIFRQSKRMRVVTLEEASVETLHEELTTETSREDLEMKMPMILEKLKPGELTIIELRFFEGRSFREIGEIVNMTEINAKVHTYLIIKKMKKLFLQ
jgi:RNA polymerase sigma-70 factor (ECF subfamily)